eukprot:2588298-Amphidinium_carterae.4
MSIVHVLSLEVMAKLAVAAAGRDNGEQGKDDRAAASVAEPPAKARSLSCCFSLSQHELLLLLVSEECVATQTPKEWIQNMVEHALEALLFELMVLGQCVTCCYHLVAVVCGLNGTEHAVAAVDDMWPSSGLRTVALVRVVGKCVGTS